MQNMQNLDTKYAHMQNMQDMHLFEWFCILYTQILALLFQRKNKGRLPASGKDASHPESHVDAD